MFCPQCGAQQDSGTFCARCGSSLGTPTEPIPVPPSTPPSPPSNTPSTIIPTQAVTTPIPVPGPAPVPRPAPRPAAATPPAPGGGGRGVAVPLIAALVVLLLLAGGGWWLLQRDRNKSPSTEAVSTTSPTPSATASGPDSAAYAAIRRSATGVGASVVAITVVGCGDEKAFNGIVVGPDLVATADQLLDETAAVGVQLDGRQVGTVIVGRDEASGIGLLRTTVPLGVTPATFQDKGITPGQVAAGVGSSAREAPVSAGAVKAIGTNYTIGQHSHANTVEVAMVDAMQASGSPLVDAASNIVGIIVGHAVKDETIAVALPGGPIAAAVARMSGQTEPIRPTVTCSTPVGPSGSANPRISIPATTMVESGTGRFELGSDAQRLQDPLTIYFQGINEAKYEQSMSVMSPSLRGTMSLESFTDGTKTSFDSDFIVHAVRREGANYVVVLEFTSLQSADKGPDGRACNRWTLDYTLVPGGGGYLIDSALGTNGTAFRAC